MATLEEIQKRLESTEQIQSVVKTMKSIAAVRVRQFEKAADALRSYRDTVEMGMQALLRSTPQAGVGRKVAPDADVGVLVFGSDQGMCGPFNERIVEHLQDRLREAPTPAGQHRFLAVGERVAAALDREGFRVEARRPVPASTEGFTPLVFDLLQSLGRWQAADAMQRCLLFHHVPRSGSSYAPRTVQLLPLRPEWVTALQTRAWGSRALPFFRAEPDRLFSALVREHLFVSIYRALAASLASENASRVASMQSAEKNIEERLDRLGAEYRRERQRSITEELLDIVAGFEVLKDEPTLHQRREK